jgi:hypothetical protein
MPGLPTIYRYTQVLGQSNVKEQFEIRCGAELLLVIDLCSGINIKN